MFNKPTKYTNITRYGLTLLFLFYCLLLIFQNPIAMIAAQWSTVGAKAILGMKDIILYISFLVIILNIFYKGRSSNIILISLLIVLIITFLALIDGSTSLLSIRQLFIIPLGLIFGTLLYKGSVDYKFIFYIYIYMMIFMIIFAYFERYIFYDDSEFFWNLLGVKEYMNMKGMSSWANEYTHVSNSFYSYDFYNYTGDKVRRMVSIIAEPTLFGQLLILPSLYYIFRKQYLLALFFIVPIFLALSKGGLLGVFVGILLYIWQEKSNNFLKTIMLIILGIIIIIVSFLYINNYVQSITNHLNGFLSNFSILLDHPFGLGIGNAGNYHNIIAVGENITAGESYLGAIVGQFGIIGLLLYFIFFKLIYKTKPNKSIMLTTIKYSMLATLITGFFSESAISYVGTSLLVILTAYLLNYQKMEPTS